ncbi:MAG: protein-glutamate O-methyltransferase CheR [Acidobacteria bacterium]|nr:protein-glutamate O-methyltransferase CheR [Acidobacteriota bacterium]
MVQALDRATEFRFTEDDFQWLRLVANKHSGIVLADAKRNMIYSRLTKRLRQLNLSSFSEYRQLLDGSDSREFGEFINAITTNLTSFFREQHHFDHLAEQTIPELVMQPRRERRIRVWSAGCSTGEEPYSIAMVLEKGLSKYPGWSYDILATDLDTQVLQRAAAGIYTEDRGSNLDGAILKRWFQRGQGCHSGRIRVKPELQRYIRFQQLNLVQPWKVDGPFDVLFCRNVVIYFDKATQQKLFDKFADVLAPGAALHIGHSETLHQVSDRFRLAGKTTYRKLG